MLFQALYPHTDAEDTQVEIDHYYAAVELVIDETTGTFVRTRDTSHDHVPTSRFPLPSIDAETKPVPRMDLEQPARRVAIGTPVPPMRSLAERSPAFSGRFALPFPVESLPFDRVEIEVFDAPKQPRQETEIIERGPSVVIVIAVLVCALALGLAVALLIARWPW